VKDREAERPPDAHAENAEPPAITHGRRHPFAGYFRNWLATYARHHCKPGTVAGYEAAGRLYLIPAFGRRDLRTITRADVKQLVYEKLLPVVRAPPSARTWPRSVSSSITRSRTGWSRATLPPTF
jgi:hypothetical protein